MLNNKHSHSSRIHKNKALPCDNAYDYVKTKKIAFTTIYIAA